MKIDKRIKYKKGYSFNGLVLVSLPTPNSNQFVKKYTFQCIDCGDKYELTYRQLKNKKFICCEIKDKKERILEKIKEEIGS